MKLYTHCSGCGEEIKIKSSATDRGKLQMKYGDEMQVNCQHCGKLEKKPLHKIRAEVNSFHLFIAFVATAFLSTMDKKKQSSLNKWLKQQSKLAKRWLMIALLG